MEKNKIDKIFSEKLNLVERKPRPEAWEKLSLKIGTSKKYGWAFYLSIAASLILLLSISIVYRINSKEEKNIYSSIYIPRIKDSSIMHKKTNVEKIFIEKKKPVDKTIIKPENKNKIYMGNALEYKNLNKKQDMIQEVTIVKNLERSEEPGFLPIKLISPIASTKKLGKQTIILYQNDLDIPTPNIKNKSKVGKILTQLRRFKKGEPVDLNELGIDKQNLLATLKENFN